ncbi:hypothetical protein CR513_20901, partial [Mucuna pruriens]
METLKQYLARFNEAMVQVDDPYQDDSLALSQSAGMIEIKVQAEKHVEAEEDKEDRLLAKKAMPITHQQYHPGGVSRHEPRMEKYTPLKTTRAHILKEVYHLQLLDIPPPTLRQLDPSHDE